MLVQEGERVMVLKADFIFRQIAFQNRPRGHFDPVPDPQRGHLRRVHQVESKREQQLHLFHFFEDLSCLI